MRWTRAALLASSLTVLLTTACGAGPSQRPGVAVEHPHGGAAATTATSTAPPPPPQAQVPKTDLSWHDCAAPTFDLLGTGPAPAGVIFECAEFSAPIDAGGSVLGTFRIAAVRARTPQTPADAAPLVLTSGSDRSSTATVAGLVSGPGSAILSSRPVVGVDHRGLGSSQPIDCLPGDIRQGLADNGQFAPGGGDRVDAMATLSQNATIACQDFLQPYQGTFDAPHAADDIEQLRKQWQVDRIDLLGAGNGSRVALSYAAKYGDHLARLVLDSPEPANADSVTRTEQQVKGAEAALTGFARRCADLRCSLGADPRAAITDLVNRAGSGQLGQLSAATVTTTISAFLGDPRADLVAHTAELADALAAAGRGDTGPLQGLVTRETAAVGADGQFVSRCSDNQQPATPDRAKQLENEWGTKYPVFGRSAATGLMACSAWPAAQAPRLPDKFALPVLVLGTAADPVVGGDGRSSVTGALGAAGARTATVQWQGWGHPVFTHSGCAQQNIVGYLKDATLPADGTACPA
ncbi:alpha/beta hydrolase [Nocardia veterana]|uniref:Alpha/beta hydrolase n=1 Tax=Nocardia veterana TaxID=132249 RepID=A0A7X6M0I2_9NOCA|nr:alpha/beta hydrolase [Nocardia veterana]NKY88050.1 alpha/beta hydrolase [Nocardia veterana]